MGLVVDTSALIAFERADSTFERLLEEHGDEVIALPAIVLAEFLVGVHLLGGGPTADRKRSGIDQLLARVPLVEFGWENAERWADLVAELRGHGELIQANDVQVAATALHWGSVSWSASRAKRTFDVSLAFASTSPHPERGEAELGA